jgi:hypothetical protein
MLKSHAIGTRRRFTGGESDGLAYGSGRDGDWKISLWGGRKKTVSRVSVRSSGSAFWISPRMKSVHTLTTFRLSGIQKRQASQEGKSLAAAIFPDEVVDAAVETLVRLLLWGRGARGKVARGMRAWTVASLSDIAVG